MPIYTLSELNRTFRRIKERYTSANLSEKQLATPPPLVGVVNGVDYAPRSPLVVYRGRGSSLRDKRRKRRKKSCRNGSLVRRLSCVQHATHAHNTLPGTRTPHQGMPRAFICGRPSRYTVLDYTNPIYGVRIYLCTVSWWRCGRDGDVLKEREGLYNRVWGRA